MRRGRQRRRVAEAIGRNEPTCFRCGERLERPDPDGQFECPGCDMVVAPDQVK